MNQPRILVAGIGNIFFGDDGFGVEVVSRLKDHHFPENVRIVDIGIRGLDLAYSLMEDYAAAILIDATPRGGDAGSLYVVEPDLEGSEAGNLEALMIEAHSMVPESVLRWVKAFKGSLPMIRILGCEPAGVREGQDIAVGLSEPVLRAVPRAGEIVLALVGEFCSQDILQRA